MGKRKITILFGILCLLSGTVLGSVGTTIKARLVQMNILKDGQQVAKGVNVISYNGTTYMPLKTVGDVAGLQVVCKDGAITLASTVKAKINSKNDYINDAALIKETSYYIPTILKSTMTITDKNVLLSESNKCISLAKKGNEILPKLKTEEVKKVCRLQNELLTEISIELKGMYNTGNFDLEQSKKTNDKATELDKAMDELTTVMNKAQ